MSATMRIREIAGEEFYEVVTDSGETLRFKYRQASEMIQRRHFRRTGLRNLAEAGIRKLTLPPGELADRLREYANGVNELYEGSAVVVLLDSEAPAVRDAIDSVPGAGVRVHDSSPSVGEHCGGTHPTGGGARKGTSEADGDAPRAV